MGVLFAEWLPDGTNIADTLDLDRAISVTGEHGDQIFGSMLFKLHFQKRADERKFVFAAAAAADDGGAAKAGKRPAQRPAQRPAPPTLSSEWRAAVRAHLRRMAYLRPDTQAALLELLQKQAAVCPFPIHSLFDWLWWINFSMKWQYVTTRTVNRLGAVTPDQFGRLQHFFRTTGFQVWAMHARFHREAKMPLKRPNDANKAPKWVWTLYKMTL